MTNFSYVQGIPAANNNPSSDQPNMLTNTNSIYGLINVDHITFGMANGGYHNVIHFNNQGTSDPPLVSGFGQLYTKTISGDQELFYESGNGVIVQMTANVSILPRAAVSFQGRSSNGACTINYQSNVASVTRTGQGFYTIAYTTALSSANYYCSLIAQRSSSSQTSLSQLTGGSPQTTTQVFVNFLDSSLNDVDPTTAQFIAFM